jgi:CheY-like chemotaxis protein
MRPLLECEATNFSKQSFLGIIIAQLGFFAWYSYYFCATNELMTTPNYQRIFLADDDEDDQLIFTEAVENINPSIVIETAYNGKEALMKLESMATPPDFIFLDINMPLMDGFECLTKLKLQEKFSSTPIIIYSTSASLKTLQTAEILGVDAFLTKPSDHKRLERKLERILLTDFSIPSSRIRIFSHHDFSIR